MNSYGNRDQGGGNGRQSHGSESMWQGRVPSISYESDDMSPKLAATFYPGGVDDFMMPELVSPSPQRIMPEVPVNMQEGIARLELEGDNLQRYERRTSSVSPVSSDKGFRGSKESSAAKPQAYEPAQDQAQRGYTTKNQVPNHPPIVPNPYDQTPRPLEIRKSSKTTIDDAFPSSFPKLQNPDPKIPPSDDEKEDILENVRSKVLKSNDPDWQLKWAQDALLWVDGAMQSRVRESADNSSRSITPRIEHQLRVDAMSIINFLADQNHPQAVFLRSLWYEFGKFGHAIDKKEAFQGYKLAAEKGYSRAEYRIGTHYESVRDMAKAIKHYNIGIALNDSAASYRLGMMNLLGQHGQPEDYELGIKRIRFAAETADENAPQGAYVYGMLLGRELPNITIPESILPVDFEKAKMYVEKAAYLGFPKAQTKMGEAYELCFLNCEFNAGLSLHYSALAARQGDPDAELAVSKWFICGFEGVFAKNDELAFKYAQRAAKSGLATAEIAMGYFYEIGMHVPIDLVQAQSWYQKAADHGHKEALGRLEGLKQQKALSKKDHEQIVVTRIRSQYGSKRGGRPDRFRDRYPPLPSVTETPASPEDPRSYSDDPLRSDPVRETAPPPEVPKKYSRGYTSADQVSETPEDPRKASRGPLASDPVREAPSPPEEARKFSRGYMAADSVAEIPEDPRKVSRGRLNSDPVRETTPLPDDPRRFSRGQVTSDASRQTPPLPEDPRRFSRGHLSSDPVRESTPLPVDPGRYSRGQVTSDPVRETTPLPEDPRRYSRGHLTSDPVRETTPFPEDPRRFSRGHMSSDPARQTPPLPEDPRRFPRDRQTSEPVREATPLPEDPRRFSRGHLSSDLARQTPPPPEDPRKYSRGYLTAEPVAANEANLQPRPKSVAPYPEDDVAPRPGSAQPRPQSRLIREGPIADRPLSAFGIRAPAATPNAFGEVDYSGNPSRPTTGQHSVSYSGNPSRPPVGQNEANYSGNPVRPPTGQSFHFVPGGRGTNPAGRDRVVSAGWQAQKPAAYGRDISPRRTPFPQDIPPQQQPYGSNQDGRNRLHKQAPLSIPQSQAPYPQTPQSRPATLAHGRHGSLPSLRPADEYGSQADDRYQYGNAPSGSGARRPERNESMPESMSRQRPPVGQSLTPSQPLRSSSASPAPPADLSSQPAVPPKKGAQSFEEMGIPHSKDDRDCNVM